MFEHGGEPDHIIEDLGLTQISDTSEIESAIDNVIKSNSCFRLQSWSTKVLWFLSWNGNERTKG